LRFQTQEHQWSAFALPGFFRVDAAGEACYRDSHPEKTISSVHLNSSLAAFLRLHSIFRKNCLTLRAKAFLSYPGTGKPT
jgi:hypothetical protein